MPKINIDELVEPIEITVGGKDYTIVDISQETAKKMGKVGADARKAEADGAEDDDSTDQMAILLTEILGAEKEDIAALGMRKLLCLTTNIMDTLTNESASKNVPEVAATK